MRTRSLAVLRLTSRMTASQSRAGLNPTPLLPINASDVREAADLRMLLLFVVGHRAPSLFSCLLLGESVGRF